MSQVPAPAKGNAEQSGSIGSSIVHAGGRSDQAPASGLELTLAGILGGKTEAACEYGAELRRKKTWAGEAW